MKKILLFSFFLAILSVSIFSQEVTPSVEFFYITENAPGTPIINCTLTAQSQCWRSEIPSPPVVGSYFLTSTYNLVSYYPEGNNMGNYSAGFDFITSTGGSGGYPDFAYGVYKVSNNASNKCFYIDYRDFRIGYYGLYSPSTYGHNIDLWVKYDYELDLFTYSTLPTYGFTSIENNQLIKLWEVKQKGNPLTYLFPNFWENALVVIPSNNNNPKLVWGPYPSSSISIQAYKIYRKVGSGNFNLIHTNSATQFEYTDTDYSIPTSGGSQLQYYVKASFVPEELSQPTNTVATNGIITLKERSGSNTFVYENCLNPNYPNPFNPSTVINYSVKDAGLVKLKVYNILGSEVTTLVNTIKEAGSFAIEFNASDLPSGVYIYTLEVNGFTSSKKMLLMK